MILIQIEWISRMQAYGIRMLSEPPSKQSFKSLDTIHCEEFWCKSNNFSVVVYLIHEIIFIFHVHKYRINTTFDTHILGLVKQYGGDIGKVYIFLTSTHFHMRFVMRLCMSTDCSNSSAYNLFVEKKIKCVGMKTVQNIQ